MTLRTGRLHPHDQRAVAGVVDPLRTVAAPTQQTVRACQYVVYASAGPLQRLGVGEVAGDDFGARRIQIGGLFGVAAEGPDGRPADQQTLHHGSTQRAR